MWRSWCDWNYLSHFFRTKIHTSHCDCFIFLILIFQHLEKLKLLSNSHPFHSSKTATHQFQHLGRPWILAWILFLKIENTMQVWYFKKNTVFDRSNVEFARLWDWNTSSTEVGNKICAIFRIYGPKQLLKTDIHQDKKKQCSSAPDPNTCSSTPICIIHHLAAWNQKQGLTICTFQEAAKPWRISPQVKWMGKEDTWRIIPWRTKKLITMVIASPVRIRFLPFRMAFWWLMGVILTTYYK